MKDEIFGPILPILSYSNIEEAIKHINSNDKPLAIYFFGDKNTKQCKRVQNETSSGAFVTNETLTQVLNPDLPFGGVGYSGYGRYHGFEGFKQCSNAKAVFIKPPMKMYPYNKILPPFTPDKQELIKKLIRFTSYGNPKIGKRIVGLLVLVWFV